MKSGFSISRQSGWAKDLGNILSWLREDAAAVAAFLGATEAEIQWAKEQPPELANQINSGCANLTQRQLAILHVVAARAFSNVGTRDVHANEAQRATLSALAAQVLLTRAVGHCLGVQLARKADVVMSRIILGASIGGLKGAATRRRDAVPLESLIKEARKLGWPDKQTGVNGRLAKKFDRTSDHIGRLLRRVISGT